MMEVLKEKIREILIYIGANEGEGLSEIMPVIEEHIREGAEKADKALDLPSITIESTILKHMGMEIE